MKMELDDMSNVLITIFLWGYIDLLDCGFDILYILVFNIKIHDRQHTVAFKLTSA